MSIWFSICLIQCVSDIRSNAREHLGAGVWFLPGKGTVISSVCRKSVFGPNGTVALSEALPTFLLLDSLVTLSSLKWKKCYSLCSGQQEDKWKKDSRLVRNTPIRQGVGRRAAAPGRKRCSGWCRYRVFNAGAEESQKCELYLAPPYCLVLQLFWFPFRIKAQPWWREGLHSQLLFSPHWYAAVTGPSPLCISLKLMSTPKLHLASASLHTHSLEYLEDRHHLSLSAPPSLRLWTALPMELQSLTVSAYFPCLLH